ncbi:MAG: aminoacyl-tRNA deacylase [Anaerolineaceae bacterium]
MKRTLKLKSTEYLDKRGISYQKLELEQAPHTAEDVQNMCHCSLEEVLKTLLFIGERSAVVAVVGGSKRVNTDKLCCASGQKSLRMAKPDEVLRITSSKVGSVSPFAITGNTKKIMDNKVAELSRVIAGSGEGTILLELTKEALKSAWDGEYAEIT